MDNGFRFEFDAIGTHWMIDILDSEVKDQAGLRKKVEEEIENFSKIFSRFDPESEIYYASKNPSEITLPQKYLKLLKVYKRLYDLTDGLFTPLVGNLLIDAGYDENYSLKPKKINQVLEWEEVINLKDNVLEIKKKWMLDFGAGGKGFIVDIIGDLLNNQQIKSYCIDASGDILYKTEKGAEIKVGLENPSNTKQVLGIANLKNGSICASCGNRRKWDKYHHIFNPKSLKSVDEVLAVWAIADEALISDCLATCLFFKDPKVFQEDFSFEYLILYPDFTIKKSGNFPGELYTTE